MIGEGTVLSAVCSGSCAAVLAHLLPWSHSLSDQRSVHLDMRPLTALHHSSACDASSLCTDMFVDLGLTLWGRVSMQTVNSTRTKITGYIGQVTDKVDQVDADTVGRINSTEAKWLPDVQKYDK